MRRLKRARAWSGTTSVAMPTLDPSLPIARMSATLVLANVRYWSIVAPLVRIELARWTWRAERIPHPTLRYVALTNLRDEGFNAQATATLATLTPRRYRGAVVEAIVGLQVMYDYLDSLVERPLADPLGDGLQLYGAFIDAVNPSAKSAPTYYPYVPEPDDGGYLNELVDVVRAALMRLPSQATTAQVAKHVAERCAEAQVRAHATSTIGTSQLRTWALCAARETGLGWREFLAGAVSSGLALHALAATAANPDATKEHALTIDAVYLSICALTTLLDGLVDYEQDLRDLGHIGYIRYYVSHDELSDTLKNLIRRASTETRDLPDGTHHLMTLVGVVAYYVSAPSASSEFARQAITQLHQELKPVITPPLSIMRVWRFVKRARASQGDRSPTRVSV
jgi:hypothetical protein